MDELMMGRVEMIAWCLGIVALLSAVTTHVWITPGDTELEVVGSWLSIAAGVFMMLFFSAMAVTAAWQEPWK